MAQPRVVRIHIMGKTYLVPAALTIMKAIEYAGYKLIRGCGCRGGFCGACGTIYRTPGDYRIKVGLACQTVVEEDMYLTQLPFFPAHAATYHIDQAKPALSQLLKCYPELSRCLGCNTCTRTCPQELKVMDYMAAAMRGDIAKVADLSFECIMCGLCASRCPAETVPYNVAILARRLYGKYMAKKAQHLAEVVSKIKAGEFDASLNQMADQDINELKKLYNSRDIEP